jgi:hypothetical protein
VGIILGVGVALKYGAAILLSVVRTKRVVSIRVGKEFAYLLVIWNTVVERRKVKLVLCLILKHCAVKAYEGSTTIFDPGIGWR